MNLDDLRSVQSKERQKDSLQHLRDSFYEDVGDYIANLKNERERAAERADDPFASSEVSQLTDEIETAEEVVEAVYERRMGKIVKRASLAAAGMPGDEEGLTTEEVELYSDLVDRIERNKEHVLDVLSGEVSTADAAESEPTAATDDAPPAPPDRPAETADAPTEAPSIDAADLMGEGTERAEPPRDEPAIEESTSDGADATPRGSPPGDDAGTPPEVPRGDGASSPEDDTDRTTVRITEEVGDIFGVDDREYELCVDDVVTLPTANAEPLVEGDAARRID